MKLLAIVWAFLLAFQTPIIGTNHRKVFSGGGGGGTWTIVQFKYRDSLGGGTGGGTCATGGTTCAVTVASITATNQLVAFANAGNGFSVTLSSVNGETWSNCPTSCATGDSGAGWVDGKYVLSATGGETSFTCTFSSAPGAYVGCGIIEYHYTGASASIDVTGSADRTTCTSCAGVTLPLTGSNDAILQWALPAQTLSAVTSPYSTNAHFYSGSGEAVSLGTASGTAPTWTQSPTGTVAVAAIALKGN